MTNKNTKIAWIVDWNDSVKVGDLYSYSLDKIDILLNEDGNLLGKLLEIYSLGTI